MARWQKFEPLYAAFQQFLERCVVDDRSLLWPAEQAWTLENVAEVRRRMVDDPQAGGELSFEEKLVDQMRGAPAQLWMIVCDLFYVYYLTSANIKYDTKIGRMQWAAQQGGLALPPPGAGVWDAQRHGFTNTSIKYHMKYAQFWLILLFAERVKAHPDPAAVVRDPRDMQRILDERLNEIDVKTDRAYDVRHAMLYLAFPDRYERIISTRDKERIVDTYRSRVAGDLPQDLDEAVGRIREVLAPEYDKPERAFDFYDSELKREWKEDRQTRQPRETGAANVDGARGAYAAGTAEEDSRKVSAVLGILEHTRNVILHGPPGTGKTYVANNVARAMVRSQVEQPSGNVEQFVMWTTFHQSYAYEDFVEGLRPVSAQDGSGDVAYEIVPGAFRRISARAAADPGSSYVLVIDEILSLIHISEPTRPY